MEVGLVWSICQGCCVVSIELCMITIELRVELRMSILILIVALKTPIKTMIAIHSNMACFATHLTDWPVVIVPSSTSSSIFASVST